MTSKGEVKSSTSTKLQEYFRQKKRQEGKDKDTAPILPRDLTSPTNWPEATDFLGHPGRAPGMTHNRTSSQSTYESGKEYQIDQTVYYDGPEEELDINLLLEEE